jgi:hypothetical protein
MFMPCRFEAAVDWLAHCSMYKPARGCKCNCKGVQLDHAVLQTARLPVRLWDLCTKEQLSHQLSLHKRLAATKAVCVHISNKAAVPGQQQTCPSSPPPPLGAPLGQKFIKASPSLGDAFFVPMLPPTPPPLFAYPEILNCCFGFKETLPSQ